MEIKLCLEGHCREVETSSIAGAQLMSVQEHCSTLELSRRIYNANIMNKNTKIKFLEKKIF